MCGKTCGVYGSGCEREGMGHFGCEGKPEVRILGGLVGQNVEQPSTEALYSPYKPKGRERAYADGALLREDG